MNKKIISLDNLESFKEKSDLKYATKEELNDALEKTVRNDIEQNLTEIEKKQARDNIDVVSLDYLNSNFVPRSTIASLYFERVDSLNATLETNQPIANANNYLTTTTSNSTIDFNSANVIKIKKVLEEDLLVSQRDAIVLSLSFAFNKNSEVEFGARIKIDDQIVGNAQAFGARTYNGDSNYTSINEQTISLIFNNIGSSTTSFTAGKTLTIELATSQKSGASLTTRIYCGVNVNNILRQSIASLKIAEISINEDLIQDGSVSEVKLSPEVIEKINNTVRTDLSQNLTDTEKQQAQKNITLRSSASLTNSGWYKIANSPNGVHLKINLSNTYTGAQPSVIQIDVYKGHTDLSSKCEIISSGVSLGYFQKLRVLTNNDIEVYCSQSTSSTTATCIIEFEARDNNNVSIFNFEASSNTGTLLKEIDIKNSINTTGNIYQNGSQVANQSQVVRIDTEQNLSSDQRQQALRNIGFTTSVNTTLRDFGEWTIATSASGGLYLLGTFSIYDTNIHMSIRGGLAYNNINYDLSIGSSNYQVNYINCISFGSTKRDLYYTVDTSNYVRVYMNLTAYDKISILAETTGGIIAGRGLNTVQNPSDKITIDVKDIMSIDLTKLVPSEVSGSGWALGGTKNALTPGIWLIKMLGTDYGQPGNSAIGIIVYDGTDTSAAVDIPSESHSNNKTFRARYTAAGWYWYTIENGVPVSWTNGAIYTKKIL